MVEKELKMQVDPTPSLKKTLESDPVSADELVVPTTKKATPNNFVDSETKQTLDKATGLLQTIVTDKISDKVIRKMPSDEYLHLLSLLDEIISGSIDKHV